MSRQKRVRKPTHSVPVTVMYVVGNETFSLSKDASFAMAPFHAHAMSETLFHQSRMYVREALARGG